MVLRVDVMDAALRAHYGVDATQVREASTGDRARAGGATARRELCAGAGCRAGPDLLCGRYEGFDERIVEHLASETSVDRSLRPLRRRAGGDGPLRRDLAQAARCARARGLGGRGVIQRSAGGGPEYPHYTRPAEYRGWRVPEILLSGHHERIREWRISRASCALGSRTETARDSKCRFPETSRVRNRRLARAGGRCVLSWRTREHRTCARGAAFATIRERVGQCSDFRSLDAFFLP